MIVTALIFLGTFVILPAGLSFAVDGDGRPKKSKPKDIPQKKEEPTYHPKNYPLSMYAPHNRYKEFTGF